MAPFTNSWNEAAPAGPDAIALGDDQIRQFKFDIRERIGVEHDFLGASGNLRHKFPYVTTAQRDAITDWVIGSICFNTDLFTGFVALQIVTAVGPVVWTTVATVDHGSLTGLADDDHTQYILAAGTRAFTGDQSMGSKNLTDVLDPTADQHAATKKYVDDTLRGQRGQVSSASFITTSTDVYVDTPGMSVTLTTIGRPVLILAQLMALTAGANSGFKIGITIDGGIKCEAIAQPNGFRSSLLLQWLEVGLAAGSHTFKMQWASFVNAQLTTAEGGYVTNRILSVIEQAQVVV